jgi:DNA-binding response OmpR family regulator
VKAVWAVTLAFKMAALLKHRVLLVDDSKEDRFLIKQSLLNAGLDLAVEEATDGEEAETYLSAKLQSGVLPDFVILDLMLPKRSGLEILTNLSRNGLTNRMRIIVLTSVLTEDENARLRDLGAWQVFEKPVDLDALLELGKSVKTLTQNRINVLER